MHVKNAAGCVGYRKRLHRLSQTAALTVADGCMKRIPTKFLLCRILPPFGRLNDNADGHD